jgi:hypothetical protein
MHASIDRSANRSPAAARARCGRSDLAFAARPCSFRGNERVDALSSDARAREVFKVDFIGRHRMLRTAWLRHLFRQVCAVATVQHVAISAQCGLLQRNTVFHLFLRKALLW